MPFDELRQDYQGAPLRKADCDPDPIKQFRSWFGQALGADIEMANAMSLATVDPQGFPHSRMVLLKDADDEGLVFFTNYQSAKGGQLRACDKAALLFWWHPMTRQIRIEGHVAKVSPQESDAYFHTRPRGSNLSAMASPQSSVIASRDELEERIERTTKDAEGQELSRPENWGGYRLVPNLFEFWQGRADRSHDRIEYQLGAEGAWTMNRLCP